MNLIRMKIRMVGEEAKPRKDCHCAHHGEGHLVLGDLHTWLILQSKTKTSQHHPLTIHFVSVWDHFAFGPVIAFSLILPTPQFSSVQFSSAAQSCPTLWDPMNRGRQGLPIHHQLLESTQTHVHWVSDAIQPSHHLSSPSRPAFNVSQHQGSSQMNQLFISGGESIGVSASISVLPVNTQDWSPLGWTGWISLQSKLLSRVFSNTTVQKH